MKLHISGLVFKEREQILVWGAIGAPEYEDKCHGIGYKELNEVI